VVIDGMPVTTGTFTSNNTIDESAPYSGLQSGPPFPGEDFLENAPDGLTFPTDLSGTTAVISIEPFPDDSPNPFTLKPLVSMIPDPATDHINYTMTNNAAGFPSGSAEIQTATSVASDGQSGLPDEIYLWQNYPNPFNPETTIRYQLPVSANVFLKIYNLQGQLVRTLINENKEAGFHEIVWDARDETGQSMPSGVYLYRIQAADFTYVKKLTLLK
jgi:hypothetical protein